MNNFYNINLKEYSRSNRKNPTLGEAMLWKRLRNKQLGYRFLRQRSISFYIVDFFQPDKKLIIEVDGLSHDESKYEYDKTREKYLEYLGYKILRFNEKYTQSNIDEVVITIYNFLN